jgi:hypothetical protein
VWCHSPPQIRGGKSSVCWILGTIVCLPDIRYDRLSTHRPSSLLLIVLLQNRLSADRPYSLHLLAGPSGPDYRPGIRMRFAQPRGMDMGIREQLNQNNSYILIHSHAKNARQLSELPDPAVQSHMPIYRDYSSKHSKSCRKQALQAWQHCRSCRSCKTP